MTGMITPGTRFGANPESARGTEVPELRFVVLTCYTSTTTTTSRARISAQELIHLQNHLGAQLNHAIGREIVIGRGTFRLPGHPAIK